MSSGSEQLLGRPSSPEAKRVGRPRKDICDGTRADYRRHYRHGERPCAESKAAWYAYYTSQQRAASARKQRARAAEKKRRAAAAEAARRERDLARIQYPEGEEGSALYRLGIKKYLKDPRPPSTPEEIEEANKMYPYKEASS